MTRTGKIARLPRELRDQLNRRLQDGQLGTKLVAWLNEFPAVEAVLQAEFAGKPINVQNLTEWKQGGYRDWLQQQEAINLVRDLSESAAMMDDAAGSATVSDRLSTVLAVELTREILSLLDKTTNPRQRWAKLGEALQHTAQLRREDHSAGWLRLERKRWEAEQEQVAKKEAAFKQVAPLLGLMNRKTLLSSLGIAPLDSPVGLAPLTEEELLPLIVAKFQKSSAAATAPSPPDSIESNQIKPDQTS